MSDNSPARVAQLRAELKKLKGEREMLLTLLDRYMPHGMAIPETERYSRWRRDADWLSSHIPGWR